jgi:6-phosphogluconolactonase
LNSSVKIFRSPYELAEKFAEELVRRITDSAEKNEPFTVALSGGSTPELLFSVLGDHFSKSAPWEYAHFFWGDERCVPVTSQDSNYGTAKRKFLDKIIIPEVNIHRIHGEDDPEKEAYRYAEEIAYFTAGKNGLPLFDMIILGLGEDGHTASVFPDQKELLYSDNVCGVAFHPVTFQKRITLTGRVINNAGSVIFLITGKKKADIIEKIINKRPEAVGFPSYYIVPEHGMLYWYIDEEAAMLL